MNSASPAATTVFSEPDRQATATLSLRWFFFFFFVSGFCSLLYELIWLRLAMAEFGVTSALAAIVLSTFMGGLGLGSWISGAFIRRRGEQIRRPLRWYALTEFLIGISAIAVPYELLAGRRALEATGISASSAYYVASAACVALALVPWCACMGATIPFAMLAIRRRIASEAQRSFSFLYLANVLGAVAGATLPLLLIEINGFQGTLQIGAMLNGMLALGAFALTLRPDAGTKDESPASIEAPAAPRERNPRLLLLLFLTGLTSMGVEVVWIREYTPYLGTMVYAFAAILALYLLSTYAGSQAYRYWSRGAVREPAPVWVLIGIAALLPLIAADPQARIDAWLRLLLGIAPFSALLGFVTPMLVDRWSGGDPDRAGKAYAVNVAGCILGPLLAGFLLLPLINERWALLILAAPWLLIGVFPRSVLTPSSPLNFAKRPLWRAALSYAVLLAAIAAVPLSRGFEDIFPQHVELRDNTATVVATGEGMQRRLFINGVGITFLTPITKFMAHMPLAFLDRPPQNALVVCFGMGTTFRSLLSWNIPATAVELVPSVPKLFGYYHSDGPQLLASPLAHIVIDDGRRYLERTSGQYDVITIDPPPPVSAAGSSLLYSKEFYAVIKRRLRPDGIVQQWLPYGDAVVQSAVAQSLKESFPYVRGFYSVMGGGFHFLASNRPIPNWNADQLVSHMPASAIHDLMEWGPQPTPQLQFRALLGNEFSVDALIARAPKAPALQDDRPVNEYFILRRNNSPASVR